MSTPLVLDPPEVADSRVALDLNAGGIRVGKEGPDWGDAAIAAAMSEQALGEVPVDFRVPNRQITIPLSLGATGFAGYAAARSQLQSKTALIQREGGWLKRDTGLYADIVNASLTIPDRHDHLGLEDDVVLKLEAIPDFYGNEEARAVQTELALPYLLFTEINIAGDYPARCRLKIDELDGDNQMFLMWAVQSRHYSADPTAALFYEAESRTPLGGATAVAGITGSSGAGSNVVRQGTLTPTYQAMLSTQASGGGAHLSGVGTFRVWARTHRPATNTGQVSIALEWGEGDFRKRTTNAAATYAADDREGAYCLTDLGLVTLTKASQGTQRWEGRIIAKSTATGDDLDVDCFWLMPANEGYGEIRGLTQFETPTAFFARDGFDQTAGALTGKTAPVGGVWAGGGDTDDFTVESTATAQRAAVSDADANTGRYAISGVAAMAAQVVQVEVKTSALGDLGTYLGPLARYTDTNNWLMATLFADKQSGESEIRVRKRVAGTVTTLAHPAVAVAVGVSYTVRLAVESSGRWVVWCFPTSAEPGLPIATGVDTALATGGALASGKPGFYDAHTGTTAASRNYDNFQAFVPTADAAIFANQSLEIRHDRVIREDASGTIWTPVSEVKGDYFRLPPSGMEGRTARVIVKGSRGDPDTMTDPGIDDLSAQLIARPSWLFPHAA